MKIKFEISSANDGWLAIINDYTGLLGLVTAILSTIIAFIVFFSQRKHNQLSVSPLPFIALSDFEDLIKVRVKNNGIGPLVIKRVNFLYNGKWNEHGELVQYCPVPPFDQPWKNFASGEVKSVRPGEDIILIEVEIDDQFQEFIDFRDSLRKTLSELTISIEYTDVYGRKFDPEVRKLSFFGRRLAPSRLPKKNATS